MDFPIRFPAPFLNSGPLPYIRSGPSPYISIFPAPYLNYSPLPYIPSGNAPFANTDPEPYSSGPNNSSSNSPYANSDPATNTSTDGDTSSWKTSYDSSGPAPYLSSTITSGYASYASSDSAPSANCSFASDLAMDTSQELFVEKGDSNEGKGLAMNDSGISCSDDSESGRSPVVKIRGSRKRKSFEPCRTLLEDDPNFHGVTVTMENKFVDLEWKFIMHSTFLLPTKKKRMFRAYVDSSDEEDINNNFTPTTEEKHCASCSVKKTPLWRDAEDGTPLCNACGIRYKKYKLRCGTCWHIPKKDEFRPTCQYCGSFYEYIYPRR